MFAKTNGKEAAARSVCDSIVTFCVDVVAFFCRPCRILGGLTISDIRCVYKYTHKWFGALDVLLQVFFHVLDLISDVVVGPLVVVQLTREMKLPCKK